MFEKYLQELKMTISRVRVRFLAWYTKGEYSLEDWHDARLVNLNRRTLMIIGATLLLFFSVYAYALKAPATFPIEEYIEVKEGTDLSTLAIEFENNNLVKSSKVLKAIVFLRGGQRKVQAGDYFFAKPVGVFTIARRITTGAYGLDPISITIPEGATVADMAIIFAKRLYKFDPDSFFRKGVRHEGYLYPDTYHFLPNTKENEVISVMRSNFDNKIAEFEEQIEESKYSLDEIVTLASIIEKEAWREKDQKLISGVLHNRLDIDMRLQVDATFTYTHNKGTYQITVSELKDEDNPYNTYVHKGLPPGPIAAVGYSSINAALNPTPSDNLFYLADRHGTTYYSRTYEQHLAKKRKYVDR